MSDLGMIITLFSLENLNSKCLLSHVWSWELRSSNIAHLAYFSWITSSEFRDNKSLAPSRCGGNFKSVITKIIFVDYVHEHFSEIALTWIPQNTFDDKSILV